MSEKEQQALEEVVVLDDPAPAVAAAEMTRLTAHDVIAPDDVEEEEDGTGRDGLPPRGCVFLFCFIR